MQWTSNVSRSFEPNSGLACAEGRLRHAVFCEAREEPCERPLPDLVVDLCSTLFLQDYVAVNPQDVLDTANSQTLAKEGEFCLRILAQLNSFVHCSDDICLAQELVRDELTGPPQRQRAWCFEQPLLRQRPRQLSIQVGLRPDDFCFLRVSLCSNFVVCVIKFMKVGRHQDRMAEDVTVINVPEVRQASIFLQSVTSSAPVSFSGLPPAEN